MQFGLKYFFSGIKGVRGFLARRHVNNIRMASDERYAKAATVLQKYFRMWKAQAELVFRQLYSGQAETQRIYFSQQVRSKVKVRGHGSGASWD